MVAAVARVIAAAAYAFGAVLVVVSGLKKGANKGWMIVEAVFWLMIGVLYLIVPERHIFLPMVLSLICIAIPTPRGAKQQQK